MKGDPSRRTKPVDNFIVIAGGIPAGAKMKDKEMNRHSYHQQHGSNSLQKPRPVATFFNVHFFHRGACRVRRESAELTIH